MPLLNKNSHKKKHRNRQQQLQQTSRSYQQPQISNDNVFMTASSWSARTQPHSRVYSQIYPSGQSEDDSEYQRSTDNKSYQQRKGMKSLGSTKNGQSSSFPNFQSSRNSMIYRYLPDDIRHLRHFHKNEFLYPSGDENIESSRGIIEKIRNFSENTTAHGVRRIFIARNPYTARLWLFGIIFCFIILIIQAQQLVMKFNRHEKITSIALKFDYMQFPAVTFCNLNPYKKSLVRMIPSVKDTMDVYENAKSLRNDQVKAQMSSGSVKKRLEKVKPLLDEYSLEQDRIWHKSHLVKKRLKGAEAEKTMNDILQNFDESTVVKISRSKRAKEKVRYEVAEAHCRCIGRAEMECIRFQSIPPTVHDKCICTYDNEMDMAWPCFNISIWYRESCNVCSGDGFCEPRANHDTKGANWPCLCRNRTLDSVSPWFSNFY
ncbi:unnamed protein product [Thelazia callipaeda]|uniref:Uncharacterized protein n=1 Tax=Thelazia callipaeda TaxID=103827 RepID=A0A0N5CXU9_THECL|nr:unnamed protein product [Thelazia callipaeda]